MIQEVMQSPFFGVTLTVAAYWAGSKIQKKTGLVICNNMIISVALIIGVLGAPGFGLLLLVNWALAI